MSTASTASRASAVVEAIAVSKRFTSTLAVDALDLRVGAGEIVALLGPNGAGKTTTVRMLVGILRPDAGRIAFTIAGRTSDRIDPADLGYLPEDRGLIRDIPILRTLEYFGELRGLSRHEARRRARAELERFELADRARDRVDRLSKGNQQKVQFLAAVLHNPRLAVLDEPFSGFDPVNQQRFVEEIRRLRNAGCAVLLSAHQMDLVEQLADRLVLMDRGRAVLEGTLGDIRARTRSGQRIELELAGEDRGDAGSGTGGDGLIESFLSVSGIERAERTGPSRIAVGLAPEASLGEVLHAITGRHRVTAVHSAPESLHRIFLRTVGRESADPEAR